MEKIKISKETIEAQKIKEHIELGIMRERLYKRIGELLTEDLRLLHNRLICGYKVPTAEELVEEVNQNERK